MFLDKDTVSNIDMMTEEERQNPNLVKEREDFKQSPISVYYGSAKPELTHTCLTCKRHGKCEDARNAEQQERWLRDNAEYLSDKAGLNRKEIDKIKHNVFIIVKCIFKEEE